MRFFVFLSFLLSSALWALPLPAQISRRGLGASPGALPMHQHYPSVQCEVSRPEDRSLRIQQVRLPLTSPHRLRFEVQSGVRKIHPVIELRPEADGPQASVNARERAASHESRATGNSTGTPHSLVGGIFGVLLTADADESITLLASENSALPTEAPNHFKLSSGSPQFEGRALLVRTPSLRQELRVRCALGEALDVLPPLQLSPNVPGVPPAERVGPEVSRINRSPAIVPNPPLRLPEGTPTGLPGGTAGSATGTH